MFKDWAMKYSLYETSEAVAHRDLANATSDMRDTSAIIDGRPRPDNPIFKQNHVISERNSVTRMVTLVGIDRPVVPFCQTRMTLAQATR